jgi:hypothetical protein
MRDLREGDELKRKEKKMRDLCEGGGRTREGKKKERKKERKKKEREGIRGWWGKKSGTWVVGKKKKKRKYSTGTVREGNGMRKKRYFGTCEIIKIC